MELFQILFLLDLFKDVVKVTNRVIIFSTLLVMHFSYLKELIGLI